MKVQEDVRRSGKYKRGIYDLQTMAAGLGVGGYEE